MGLGLVLLSVGKPLGAAQGRHAIMNFALGFSCFHTLVINLTLLPKPLRAGLVRAAGPGRRRRLLLVAGHDHAIETLRPYF